MIAPRYGRRIVPVSLLLALASISALVALRLPDRSGDAASPPPAPTHAQLVEAGREQFTRIRHTEPVDPKLAAHRMFNARSCAECHRQAGTGGGGPIENNVQLFDINTTLAFLDWNVANVFGTSGGPVVLHRRSLAPDYAMWRLSLLYRYVPKNLEVAASPNREWLARFAPPLPTPQMPIRGGFSAAFTPIEERNTPPLFGLGLLESIAQSEIDAVALGQPQNIRGRSPRLKDGGHGRFGWKAGRATLLAFNENACAVELGLTTPNFTPASFRPAAIRTAPRLATHGMIGTLGTTTWYPHRAFWPTAEEPEKWIRFTRSPEARTAMRAADPPPAPDMSHADLAALTHYVASLPAPRQVIEPAKREQVAAGARHFEAIGCAACHTPNLGGVTGVYSDLLLHSVGTSGGAYYGGTPSDGAENFDFVRADEFRTPPLWGVADSAPYMHDGGATTLETAIYRHKAQASSAADAYHRDLKPKERRAVIAFLESLRAP